MLLKFVEDDPCQWYKLVPTLLFTVWEVPQASMGFSPLELLYGQQPQGILEVLKETWEAQESQVMGSILYILELQE